MSDSDDFPKPPNDEYESSENYEESENEESEEDEREHERKSECERKSEREHDESESEGNEDEDKMLNSEALFDALSAAGKKHEFQDLNERDILENNFLINSFQEVSQYYHSLLFLTASSAVYRRLRNDYDTFSVWINF